MSPKRPAHVTDADSRPIDMSVPGWKFNFAAGFVPLLAGLLTLMVTWVGVSRSASQWWIGAGSLDFTFGGLSAAGPDAGSWVEIIGSVGGVNTAAAAIAVSVVAYFGLRVGQRWAWWFLLFSLLWVGLHDAVVATLFFSKTGAPLMLMPYAYCILMAVGLARSRRAVFSPH